MKAKEIIILLVIVAIGAAVWCFGLRQWPCERPPAEPIVDDADAVWKPDSSSSPMPKPPMAISRPLIEYPDAGLSYLLIKPPSQLEKEASKVSPRPLIEYSDSVLSSVLVEALLSPPLAPPRPLVEYANSGSVLVLEQPTSADFSQVQPHPLVEYADAGWIKGLNPPLGLLKERE